MNLGYFAADTIGVTLYQIKNGLMANEVHQVKLGPWRVELPIDVTSDVLSGTELGLWVTFAKVLRTYVIIREKENWFFILNTDTLKQCGEQTGFAGDTAKARIVEFKPAILAVFRWKGSEWERMQYSGGATTTIGG